MLGKASTNTIYKSILPNYDTLWKIAHNIKISKEAKHRLQVLDFYFNKSNHNVSLTARHFGVTRSYVYKWLKRFNPEWLPSLESKSRRPHNLRSATYDHEIVEIITKIRKEYPTYSSFKVEVLLRRDYDIKLSHATIGRIIKKYDLYFSRVVELHRKRSLAAKRAHQKSKTINRLQYHLQCDEPRRLIEFDLKHISSPGGKQYAFCAIDTVTKDAIIHVAGKPSSFSAQIAIEEAVKRFGRNIIVVCDNGSENFKDTFAWLKANNIPQVFARPHTPKDKPHIENFIGKYQKECLNETIGDYMTIEERQSQANKWLSDWRFYRPHQSLGYLTPAEFCDMLGLTMTRKCPRCSE